MSATPVKIVVDTLNVGEKASLNGVRYTRDENEGESVVMVDEMGHRHHCRSGTLVEPIDPFLDVLRDSFGAS